MESPVKLLEKIVRAKVILEGMKKKHLSHCVTENDPESHGPCNCGVSEHNGKIDSVLAELKLEE